MPEYEPWDAYQPGENKEPGFFEKLIIMFLSLLSDIFWRK